MKTLFKFTLTFLIAFVSVLSSNTIHAATSINIQINGKAVSSDAEPIIQSGVTYVPMRVLEEIDGLKIKSWNNNTKTLSVMDNETDSVLTLQINKTIATKDKATIKLERPAIVSNNRVLVPMRFIAEAFNCDVAWNSSTRTVFVAKSTPTQQSLLNGSDITKARSVAINLPQISTLSELKESGDSLGSLSLYFPKGVSNKFFTLSNGVISYYSVTKNASWLNWQASLSDKKTSNAPFYVTGIKEEQGKRPTINTNLFYYDISTHAGLAQYGEISTTGKTTQYGEKDLNNLDNLFAIPEENK